MTENTNNKTNAFRLWEPLPVMVLAIVVSLILLFLNVYTSSSVTGEHIQVLSRYVAHFHAGDGLVFNTGERVLLIASPLYMILASFLTWKITFIVAAAIAAGSLLSIARAAKLSFADSTLIAVIGLIAWPLWAGAETAYPLMTALCLLAFALAVWNRWTLAGIVIALAIFCSPEAALLGLLLLIFAVTRGVGKAIGYLVAGIIPLLIGIGLLFAYYGSSLWTGLLLLKPLHNISLDASVWPIAGVLLFLGVIGWFMNRKEPIMTLAGAWIVLYVVVVGVVLHSDPGSRYAPVAEMLALLAIAALHTGRPLIKFGFYVMAILMSVVATLAAIVPPPASQPFTVSLPAQSVGVVGSALVEQYRFPTTTRLDSFDGQFQPDLKSILDRSDTSSALVRQAPDFVLTDPQVSSTDLTASAGWKQLGYTAQGAGFYQRAQPVGTFTDQKIDATFGPDIHLVGFALDQSTPTANGVVRVRLDWQVAKAASDPVSVTLKIADSSTTYGTSTDQLPQTAFPAGNYSTYHALVLGNNVPTGKVDVSVSLAVNGGTLGQLTTLLPGISVNPPPTPIAATPPSADISPATPPATPGK